MAEILCFRYHEEKRVPSYPRACDGALRKHSPKNSDLNPGAHHVLPQSVSRGLEVYGKGQPVLRWLLMEIRAPSTWPCFDFHFDRLKGSCPSCGSNSKLKPQLCSEQDMRLTPACARRACNAPFPLWVPLYVLAQQKISLDLVLRRRKREATQVVLLNGKENQVILE